MMVVDLTTEPALSAGLPRLRFEGRLFAGVGPSYGVSPDGQRFLRIQPVEPDPPPTYINVVLNWAAELRRIAPR
jgi:hypothetical protein